MKLDVTPTPKLRLKPADETITTKRLVKLSVSEAQKADFAKSCQV